MRERERERGKENGRKGKGETPILAIGFSDRTT